MEESITVSIPYYKCAETIDRAVNSVLNQTHKNLIVVVVVDGDDTPELPEDDRLFVYRLPENRGRYFADAVVLAACNTDWFTVHDADDWSEPDRYEHMLRQNAKRQNPVIASAETVHNGKQSFRLFRPKSRPGHMDHLWHMSALYRTSLLRDLMHPEFRVGYDTLLCNILQLNAPVTISPEPKYHRVVRRDSLMNNDATGMKSPFRRQQAIKLHDFYQHVKKISPQQESLAHIRDMIVGDCTSDTLHALEFHADKLRSVLPEHQSAGDASDVVLTTLTGGRPDLLAKTLTSLSMHYPEVLKDSKWIVYVNGNDEPSRQVLIDYEGLIDKVITSEKVTPIGESISLLAAEAERSEREYWLHLEDDWYADICTGWLEQAKRILAESNISQVRLRQSWEKTLQRNMVTKQPIRWRQRAGWKYGNGHLTFNPSLMRVKDIEKGWPCTGETDAQSKWHRAGCTQIGQLIPGVWRHIGHHKSLRIKRQKK